MATAAATLTSGGNGTGTQATGTQGTQGTQAAPAPGWWDTSVKDAGLKTWLSTKGAPDVETALKSYHNLEQLFGADKAGRTVMLPKDDNDAEGWASLSKRLGVPDTADGYKLPIPEQGGDDGFARTAADWFREAGVPPRSATKVAEKWNSWVAEQVQAAEAADRQESERQIAGLEKEWGTAFTERQELARRGYREFAERFGLNDKAALERAESVLGAANLTKFFAGLGQLNSEDMFAANGGPAGRFSTSAHDAQKEIDEIRTKRIKGEIDDDQWRRTYGPRTLELGKIVAQSLPRT